MVILFEIISIYKPVTMIKRVYKIGEYFYAPTPSAFLSRKAVTGFLPLPLLGEEVMSQAYQGWYCGFAIDLLFALSRNRSK